MTEFIFPYEYVSTGYWRAKGVPKGTNAETLHGDQVLKKYEELFRDHCVKHQLVGFVTSAEPNPLKLLQDWKHKHKARWCRIEIDDGYGATCWRLELRGEAGRLVYAAECSFWTGDPPDYVVFVHDDKDEESEHFQGLEAVILAGLARWTTLFGDEPAPKGTPKRPEPVMAMHIDLQQRLALVRGELIAAKTKTEAMIATNADWLTDAEKILYQAVLTGIEHLKDRSHREQQVGAENSQATTLEGRPIGSMGPVPQPQHGFQ